MNEHAPRVLGVVLVAIAAAAGLAGLTPRAHGLPTYAARIGFTCVTCHFDPNGGGPRKDIGFLFARNRHDLTPDPDPQWSGLVSLTNNLGDVFYFGTNMRALYVYNKADEFAGTKAEDISTFFQMQGALYTALRPHKNLVLVWNQDFNEFSGVRTRDLWGMIDGLPTDLYFLIGQFRLPFGLRWDDHNAGTRGGFLSAGAGGSGGVLPYDPRSVESGIQTGGFPGRFFWALALTNGGAAFANKAQTVSAKIGYNKKPFQIAVSGYDSYRTSTSTRASRWSAYALWGGLGGDLTIAAEVAGGEDENSAGDKASLVGTAVQVDYRFSRWLLIFGRYDYANRDLEADGFASERFAGETVFTVVPFADVRLGYRHIRPEMTGNENQLTMMWHFYY
jgi:hypothetical protein